MVVACLVGGVAGLIFRPLFLVPVVIIYGVIQLTLSGLPQTLPHLSILHFGLEVIGLNIGYLAGALLRRMVCFR
jgi:hypothetical protein